MKSLVMKEMLYRRWEKTCGWLALCFRKFRKGTPENQKASLEKQFVERWTLALAEKADVFNGLYGALLRIQAGTAKKKGKVLSEWWSRTRYQWEGKELAAFCRPVFEKLLAEDSDVEYRKYARLLLEAASAAGITRDVPGKAVLDELTTNAYMEWEGKQLYLGDHVEILFPAWYQKGCVVEQGNCRSLEMQEG